MESDRRSSSIHCAAHALSIAAGSSVVVPMASNGSAFKGRCALFTTGYWREEDRTEFTGPTEESSHSVVQRWGPSEACQLATFVGIFTTLYGAAQGWRCLFYSHGRHDDTSFSSFLTVSSSVCVLFSSAGASVILSSGFSSWCDTVTNDNTRPYSCAESQSVPLYSDVNTSTFYTDLSSAQASLWFVTASWSVQSISAFSRLYHSHRQHITGPWSHRDKESSSEHSPSDSGSPTPPLPPATPTVCV